MFFKQNDELDLHALLDAQLNAEDEKRVLSQLAVNHEMMNRYRELKQQKELLQQWWFMEKEEDGH